MVPDKTFEKPHEILINTWIDNHVKNGAAQKSSYEKCVYKSQIIMIYKLITRLNADLSVYLNKN